MNSQQIGELIRQLGMADKWEDVQSVLDGILYDMKWRAEQEELG